MMSRYAVALLLMVGIAGHFAPQAVTCARAGGHGSAAAFAQHAGEQPLYPPQANQESERVRSLEMDDFKVEEVPGISKDSSPIIFKLSPPEAKAAVLHANLPLRFGRASPPAVARMLQSQLNLTPPLGRSPETDPPVALHCHLCARAVGVTSPSATLPQRFGRTYHFYSRPARTLATFLQGISAQPQRSPGRGWSLDCVDDVREDI